MRAAIPGMRRRAWGRIINTASAHSLVASPFKSAYVAAKHGVAGLTKAAALELAPHKVTVNCISPGFVLTPLLEAQIQAIMPERAWDGRPRSGTCSRRVSRPWTSSHLSRSPPSRYSSARHRRTRSPARICRSTGVWTAQ